MAIKKPHELEVKAFIKCLIYGVPGSGKSTLAISAPRPLYIDCDGSSSRLNPLHQCDTIEVTSWEGLMKDLQSDLSDYDTLVIDTAGKMIGYMTDYICQQNSKNRQSDGSLTIKGYGVRKNLFNDFFRRIADMQKHLVFVAHNKDEKRGDISFSNADIGGSSGDDLIRELDLVGYIKYFGGERTISFDPAETNFGKNTCGIQSLISIPNSDKNDFLTKVFADFQNGVKRRKEMGIEYKNKLDAIYKRVDEIKTSDNANALYKEFSETASLGDSNEMGKKRIVLKCKELGFVANKETKLFEIPKK